MLTPGQATKPSNKVLLDKAQCQHIPRPSA